MIIFTNICQKQRFYLCVKSNEQGRGKLCEKCKSRQKRYYLNPQKNLLTHESWMKYGPPFFGIPFQSRFSRPFEGHEIRKEQPPDILQTKPRPIPPFFQPWLQNVQHRLGSQRPLKEYLLSPKGSAQTLGHNPLLSDEPILALKEKYSELLNPPVATIGSELPTPLDSARPQGMNLQDTNASISTSAFTANVTLPIEKPPSIIAMKGTKCHENEIYYSGSCYTKPEVNETLDFGDALLQCQEYNSKLIIINNDEEESFIAKLTQSTNMSVWIGLRNTTRIPVPQFQWVDGTIATFPDKNITNGNSEGHCMSVASSGNESLIWRLKDCSENLTYICERDERPILHLKDGCLEGWEHAGNRCYKVFSKPASWIDSERHCTTFGAHLASAGSVDEEDILRRLSQSTFVSDFFSSVWIGLEITSESNFSWTDNTPKGYLNWAEGQPDFHQAKEHCGSATRASFRIHDSPCNAFLPFICEAAQGSMVITKNLPQRKPNRTCEDDPSWLLYNNHCYKIFPSDDDSGQTWYESRRLCREIGGELASIHNVEENYWLQSQVHSVKDNVLWIGGFAYFRSGYEWADETPFDYSNWAKGEPNNHYDQEDCIAFYTRSFGYWNDQNCGHKQGRICKRAFGTMHSPHVTTPVPEGNCPEGWIHTGIKCLKFFKAMATFDNARSACKNMTNRGELASISSLKEQAYVTAALGELKINMWLGLRYAQGFHWLDQSALTFTNWAQGEPNSRGESLTQSWLNEDRNENCVNTHISNLAGQWNDINCELLNGYICQTSPDSSRPSSNPFPKCSPPFESYVKYDNKCYWAETGVKTWKEAELSCINEGGHLASAANKAESSWLWVLAQQYNLENPWIGCNNLEDAKVFRWSDTWPMLYTEWGKGEPVIGSTNHSCATLNSENGLWFLENCEVERNFICKYNSESSPTPDTPTKGVCPYDNWLDLGGGSCYTIVTHTRPWTDANKWCANLGSNLASIHSKAELTLIIQAAHNITDPMWIGLIQMREGFGWSDGSGYDFINWQTGEPNNGREECVEMYPGSGHWNDNVCNNARPFICKATKVNFKSDTLGSPKEQAFAGSSNSTIIGIIMALLTLVLGGLLCLVHYFKRRPQPLATSGTFGFDNAVYSGDENEYEVTNAFHLEESIIPANNDESDTDDDRDDSDSS
ncbi:macrophage mannose receptor 1-like isoform X2 [Palaemon carinicauda]|uniref:macrophage mannose receptor 1-like isoform X2 n=1 Tax=Palaemon carinicauda TaxID=392227 RepID=UPI0035B5D7CE